MFSIPKLYTTLPPGGTEWLYGPLVGTTGDDNWNILAPLKGAIYGRAGQDTVNFGALKLSDASLSYDQSGAVHVVWQNPAWPNDPANLALYDIEKLVFNNGQDVIDVLARFGDITPPVISTPAPAFGVAVGNTLEIGFSEAIKLGTGAFQVKQQIDQKIITGTATVDGSKLVLHFDQALSANTSYDLSISPGAVTDLKGNALQEQGIFAFDSSPLRESFSTAPKANTPHSGSLALTGTLFTGQTLHVQDTLSDPDGLGSYNYVWSNGNVVLQDSPSKDFVLTDALAGQSINVSVKYADKLGYPEFAYAQPSKAVGSTYTAKPTGGWMHGSSNGDDILIGSAQTDYIITSEGSNHVDGGAGVDTVLIRGDHSQYTITNDHGTMTVADHTGQYNTSVLTNVERIAFYNSILAFDVDGNAGQAYRLYRAAFDRQPDWNGLGDWITGLDKGMSLVDAAQGFVNSPEWAGLYANAHSNRDIATLLYQHVLHRQGETAGLDYWTHMLDDHLLTLPQVLVGFSESPESKAVTATLVGQGIEYIATLPG